MKFLLRVRKLHNSQVNIAMSCHNRSIEAKR
jgi:hypothetical protein